MAVRAAVVGGSGYTGAELLRLLAGHPEIEVVAGHRRHQRGCARRRPLPLAGRRLRGSRLRAGRPRPSSPGSTSCSCACPTASRSRWRPGWSTPSATSSISGPTSACRSPTTSSGTASPTRRPSWSGGSPSGCRSSTATRSSPPGTSPHRAATRPRRPWPWPRCSPPASSSTPGSWSTPSSGVSGAGRGLKATSLFAEVSENVNAYGLLTHRHTAEIELALTHVAGDPVQVLFTPHLVPDDPGHPRHLLRTAGRRREPEHRRPRWPGTATSTRPSRSCTSTDEPPATKATLGSNAVPRHRALRRAHADRARHRRARQPGEGCVGPGAPERQPAARPARDLRPLDDRSDAVSVTSVPGFAAGGIASGIKESGAPDLADGRDRRSARGAGRGRVHHEPGRRRAGPGQPPPPRRRAGRRGGPHVGQRQRGDRRAGRADACRMCELTGAGARRRGRPTCSCARPG